MHEMSVVTGIVNIAAKEAEKYNIRRFDAVELEIGTLSGIELDALDFVWTAATKDTVLEKAKKIIRIIPAKAKCNDCGKTFEIQHYYESCPECGSWHKTILQGKELRIKSLHVPEK